MKEYSEEFKCYCLVLSLFVAPPMTVRFRATACYCCLVKSNYLVNFFNQIR